MISDLANLKAQARLAALQCRADQDPALGAAMMLRVLRDCLPPAGAVVAGFWPLKGEIDTVPLLKALAAKKFEICLPVTPAAGSALTFQRWQPGAALSAGRFGTRHSTGAMLTPDYILAPLLAFDRHGNRLGYGGGYYDRTFAALPDAFRLGCGFSVQEMDEVPTGPDDVKLHAIATEFGVRAF